MSDSLSVVVPVFNEEGALEEFLPRLVRYCSDAGHKLIVVDDGSTDGTAVLLDKATAGGAFEVVRHKLNRGYGGAIKSGIALAQTRYVITVDGDGQHRLEDIEALYEEIVARDADMVIGNRGNLHGEGLYRKSGKWLIRAIAHLLLKFDIRDLNSGMKICDTRLAQRYLSLCPDTMAWSDTIALVFISQRRLVTEYPITVQPRRTGASTINAMTALDTVKELFNIVVLFNPMKIFFPLAVALILAGLLWGLPIVLAGRGVSVGAMLALTSGLIFFLLGLIAEQLSMMRKSSIGDDIP